MDKALENILRYISNDKSGAAVAWVKKIWAKCVVIAQSPETGRRSPRLGNNVRISVVGRYMIVYRLVGERLEVLRVIPGGANITDLSI